MSWKWWRLVVNPEAEEKHGDLRKRVEVLLESVDEALLAIIKYRDSLDIYMSSPVKPYAQPPLGLEKHEPDLALMNYTAFGVFYQNTNVSSALHLLSGVKKQSAVVVRYILGDKTSYYEVYILSESERTVAMLRTKLIKTRKVPPKKIFSAIEKHSIIGKGEKIERKKLIEKLLFNPSEIAVIARTLPHYVPWITFEEFKRLLLKPRIERVK